MVRGRVSCEEIIVDADTAKREMLITLMVQVLAQEDKAIYGEAKSRA